MDRDKKIAFSVAAVALAVSASVVAVHKNPKSTYVSHYTTVNAPLHVVYPQVAFIGDSYTGGSDMGGRGPDGWPAIVTAKHRWYPNLYSVGGSGFIVGGQVNLNFAQRLPDAETLKPQLLIVWASRNDIPKGPAAISQAASSLFQRIHHDLPVTKVVVIGPAWINSNIPAVFYAARDVEQSAAQQQGFAFVDPLAEGWFGGAASALIGSDKVHPTDTGHQYLAGLIDRDLTRLGITRLPQP